jgi:Holliday junction resolvase-like predicted endonuclease
MRVSRLIQGTFRSCLVIFEHEGFKVYTRNIQARFGYIDLIIDFMSLSAIFQLYHGNQV